MAQYRVQDPSGNERIIEGPDGASDEEIITQAQKLLGGAVPPEEPGRTLSGTAGDVGTALKKGVVGAGQSLVGIGDIVSGGRAGKALEDMGIDLGGAQEALSKEYSPQQKKEIKAINDAKGFTGTLKAYTEHPAAAVSSLVEMAPEMAVMGGVGKAAKLTKLAKTTAGAVGVGEGVVTAGSAAEQSRELSKDKLLTSKQTMGAVGSGAITGLLGVVGNKLTTALGGNDVTGMLIGRTRAEAEKIMGEAASTVGGFRRIMTSAFGEGVLEELPQSAQEQMWHNYSNDKPLMEGVPEASAQGLAVGTIAGGGLSAVHGGESTAAPLPNVEEALANVQKKQAKRAQADRAAAWGAPPGSRIYELLVDGALHTPEGVDALEKAVTNANHKVYEDVANKDIDEARKNLVMEPNKQSAEAPEAAPLAQEEAAKVSEEPTQVVESANTEATKEPTAEPIVEPQVQIPLGKLNHAVNVVTKIEETLAKPDVVEMLTIPATLKKAAEALGVYDKTHKPIQVLGAVKSKIAQQSVAKEGVKSITFSDVNKAHTEWNRIKQQVKKNPSPENNNKLTEANEKLQEVNKAFQEQQAPTQQPIQEPTWTPEQNQQIISPEQNQPSTPVAEPSMTSSPEVNALTAPNAVGPSPAVVETASENTAPFSENPPTPASEQTSGGNQPPPPPSSRVAQILAERPPPRRQPGAIVQTASALRQVRLNTVMKHIRTQLMASEHAYIRALRQQFNKIGLPFDIIKGLLLDASNSQAVKDTSVAINGMQEGSIDWVPDMHKWVSVAKKDNLMSIHNIIKRISTQYNEKEDATRHLFNTMMTARRILGVYTHAANIRAQAQHMTIPERKLFFKLPANAHALELATPSAMGMTQDEALEDMKILQERPEFHEAITMWNKVRENVIDVLVKSGRFSRQQAENYLANAEYVPFYRVMQEKDPEAAFIAMSGGMGMSLTGRQKLYRMKGHTNKDVKDVLTNMEDWIVNSFSMAVRAHKARQLVDLGLDWLPDGSVEKVGGGHAGSILIYRNGRAEHYVFDDPLFPFAFKGLESITTPGLRLAAMPSNWFRRFIILNPVFTVFQLPKDTFEAMFTSGVKYPLVMIPGALKEFLASLVVDTKAHKALKEYSIVGIRDFSAVSARAEADTRLGLNQKPSGLWGKIEHALETFSMKGDNAVRQAVYNRTMSETNGDKALAMERASEIINFRKRGASSLNDMFRQIVPFYGAYWQVQSTALKTLSGEGIAPIERKQALWRLLSTSAQVYTLGFIYNALLGDDDDYQAKSDAEKNSHIFIMGGDSPINVPIRPSLYSVPFAVANIGFKNLMDNGTNDPEKARAALFDAFINAAAGPPMGPTLIKPSMEVAIDHDFFTGRDIVGNYLKNKATSEQYTAHTSELAKVLGRTGWMAPVNIDHLIKGYLGYAGTALLTVTNFLAAKAFDLPIPAMTKTDRVRLIPGMSLGKDVPTGNITDAYALMKDVTEAQGTKAKMEKEAGPSGKPEKLKQYATDNKYLLSEAVKSNVADIQKKLNDIREKENAIILLPYSTMSAEEKRVNLHELATQKNLVVSNIKQLRRAAYHGGQ